jgi:hypothetical protein
MTQTAQHIRWRAFQLAVILSIAMLVVADCEWQAH